MAIYKIDCQKYRIGEEEFDLNCVSEDIQNEKILETETNGDFYCTFIINCNNKNDNNSFDLNYYGDDQFVIEKNRCEVNVFIKENKTSLDKNFTIICSHSNDNSVYIQITIVQKAAEYDLRITNIAASSEKKYTKQLQSIITTPYNSNLSNSNYNYYEKQIFNILVKGGSKKYRIETILKCNENTDNDNQINYYSFDNGFIYNKFEDRLEIINYGRPFLNENDYYIIKLVHEDYRDLVVELKLTYAPIPKFPISQIPAIQPRVDKQVSELYISYEKFMEKLENENNNEMEQINNVECEIVFDEEINDELIIIGQPNDIVLPFNVYENNEISDLMVRVYSSGNWCSLITDETNRNLIIKINNLPLGERKSLVSVSIIDYPQFSKTFLLINKPLLQP